MNEIPDIRERKRNDVPDRDGGSRHRPDGECYCPNCRHREPPEYGVPCYTRKCPRCGSLMANP